VRYTLLAMMFLIAYPAQAAGPNFATPPTPGAPKYPIPPKAPEIIPQARPPRVVVPYFASTPSPQRGFLVPGSISTPPIILPTVPVFPGSVNLQPDGRREVYPGVFLDASLLKR
jgi:hypothetical protein